MVEQARRSGEPLLADHLLGDDVAVDAVQRVALAGDVTDRAVVRHDTTSVGVHSRSGVGDNRAGRLAEADARPVVTAAPAAQRDRVAVLEERPRRAVGEGQRLGAAPRQLDEAAALALASGR